MRLLRNSAARGSVITVGLICELREHFRLDWRGIHGAPHWARVRQNGLRLAAVTGANTRVVEAFAMLHDSCRESNGHDPGHGWRAAVYARSINGILLRLNEAELDLLAVACEGHSDGGVEGEVTVCTCWDADRLDLGRVAIPPDPARLCTEAAKDPELLKWAYRRSLPKRNDRLTVSASLGDDEE